MKTLSRQALLTTAMSATYSNEAIGDEATMAAGAATTATDKPTTNIIEVTNPNKEELAKLVEDIKVNYDFDVDVKDVAFNFKKSKDKDTGIETIRKPVVLAVPYPSVQGIIAILEKGGKGLDLLIDAMETVVNAQARDLLYDGLDLTAATFPVEKLSWEYIAHIPKAQRKGGGIPKEVWEGFCLDYIAIMPEATGKSVDQITNASKILMQKLAPVKTNEAVINLLVEQLAIYADKSENYSEYQECVDFLLNKADTFLNVTEEQLLANL